jgi:GNAT superfamily N-acetyltransferase
MQIEHADSDEQIAATFAVMHQLRPHLERENYVALIRALMSSDGFRLAVLTDDGEVRAVAGYRYMHMLYSGPVLFVDDLVADERERSRGHGARMLDWLKAEARRNECSELQLISRVIRERAHRFYFRQGLGIECFHFRIKL